MLRKEPDRAYADHLDSVASSKPLSSRDSCTEATAGRLARDLSMTFPGVSVVIANQNGKEYLARCLPSLMAQIFQDFEVIVVDNGSSDDSTAFLQENFPAVRLLQNDENRGFAGANNQGIATARGKYIVTLNNDTEVDPDWLRSLVAAADLHPDIGAFASLILLDDKRDVIDSAGLSVSLLGHGCQNRLGETATTVDSSEEVFGVCAAAAMYRKDLFDDVGLFDEDFFAYYEDVDLAWRARLRGWRSMLVPQAVVYHVHSATGGRGSHFKKRMMARNRVWAILKNYPSPGLLLFAPLIIAYEVTVACLGLLSGDPSSWLGLWQGIRGAVAALEKRGRIQSGRLVSLRELIPLMCGFREPFSSFLSQRRTGRL